MEQYFCEWTDDTPLILMDANKGVFLISGKCIPKEPIEFFTPIIEWVERYVQKPNDDTRLVFDLNYFNVASPRYIMRIINQLHLILEQGKSVSIYWIHEQNDLDLKEAGLDFAGISKIPFAFFEKPNNEDPLEVNKLLAYADGLDNAYLLQNY